MGEGEEAGEESCQLKHSLGVIVRRPGRRTPASDFSELNRAVLVIAGEDRTNFGLVERFLLVGDGGHLGSNWRFWGFLDFSVSANGRIVQRLQCSMERAEEARQARLPSASPRNRLGSWASNEPKGTTRPAQTNPKPISFPRNTVCYGVQPSPTE